MSVEDRSKDLLAVLQSLPNDRALPLARDFMAVAKESAKNAEIIVKTGLVPVLVETVRNYSKELLGRYALVILVNLAIFPVTHTALLQADCLNLAISLLDHLKSTDNDELDLGLTAAFLICRTVGKDESGPGCDAIRGNPILIEKLKWLLETVHASPADMAIGYSWNPTYIMMDVSILSTSDRNKPLLAGFILLILKSIIKWRYSYPQLINYAVTALSQLYFEPQLQPEFDQNKIDLLKYLKELSTTTELERETAKTLASLVASLESSVAAERKPVPAKKSVAARKGVFSRMLPGKTSTTKSDASPSNAGHVMISYQWDAQDIAKAIHKALTNANIKTWFDINDMGPNIYDSMAYAVENAWAIVILVSRRYKESPNCRKECEMADRLSKPVVFVKVENYNPQGWLDLIMGGALWIDCTSSSKVSQATDQVVKRVCDVGTKADKVLIGPQPRPSSTSGAATDATTTNDAANVTSTNDNNDNNSEVLSLLNKILSNIDTLQNDVNQLRAEVRALKN